MVRAFYASLNKFMYLLSEIREHIYAYVVEGDGHFSRLIWVQHHKDSNTDSLSFLQAICSISKAVFAEVGPQYLRNTLGWILAL
jgi:aspartyl/asparaginyl beta-hydroxylase (cupin superfamily)